MGFRRTDFVRDSDSFELVNPISFALGIESGYLNSAKRSTALMTFKALALDEELSYVRALCTIRNIVLKQYHMAMAVENSHLHSLGELFHFPSFVFENLKEHGNTILAKAGIPIYERVRVINAAILEHLDSVKSFIPAWEKNGQWLLDLFKFPEFETEAQLSELARNFYINCSKYPFRLWVNTTRPYPQMLLSDYYLMWYVYKDHGEVLSNWSKYKLQNKPTEQQLADRQDSLNFNDDVAYLKDMLGNEGEKVFLVDGQNIQPELVYRLADWVEENKPGALSEVFIFGDGREKARWLNAQKFVKAPITTVNTGRVVGHKSVVDTGLVAKMCQLFYERQCKTFFVLSSDSDFLPMTNALPGAKCCFCGHSKSMAFKAIDFAGRVNARCICLDKFFSCYERGNLADDCALNEIVAQLNTVGLDAGYFLSAIQTACESTGRPVDDAVIKALLSELFSNYRIKVTKDSRLEFIENKKRQNRRCGA